jgi:hypothetical protein
MLPPHLTELLTAYVDGETTPRQQKAVTRLLRRSAEARRLLEQLESDSSELRRLPRARCQRDFAGPVLAAILRHDASHKRAAGQITARAAVGAAAPIIRNVPGRRSVRSRLAFVVNAAVAASVMLAAGFGSFWFLSNLDPHNGVAVKPTPTEARQGEKPATGPEEKLIDDQPQMAGAPMIHESVPLQPYGPLVSPPPTGGAPSNPQQHLLTSLQPKPQPYVRPKPHLMSIVPVREVDQAPGQEVLKEIQQRSASRIDLFCGDLTRGFDRLQAAFAANGVTLTIDTEVKARLARHQKVALTVYSEDLTAEELARILKFMAAEDRKSASGAFGMLTTDSVSAADMAKVLGGEAANYQSAVRGPLGVDLTKPVADQTALQIVDKLGEKGGEARAADRKAVVIVYSAQQSAAPKDVRLLVDGRKEWRAGNVQVLFVLWPPA